MNISTTSAMISSRTKFAPPPPGFSVRGHQLAPPPKELTSVGIGKVPGVTPANWVCIQL
ncbi:hypothetical protein ACEQUB_p00228 (plasmid) [Ralstonia syzygii]